ncbi:MAG: LytTR family DNA-binding domain-containing protein [Novibacillus thermophilus]|jgi:two-component system response regulator LytT
MTIRAMIAEDERLVREELAYLLQLEDDVVLCPSAETGEQLLALEQQYKPDVIFLDIQMPGLSGVEVAKQMKGTSSGSPTSPLFVFTTAYDDYAVEAFELEAVDYLLKPYDEKRFKIAMERVRRRLSQPSAGERGGRDTPVSVQTQLGTAKIMIHDGERSVILSPESICYAVRVRRVLEIHTEEQVLRTKMTLQELERKLRGFPFFRSHRGYLVNLDYVHEITPWFNGTYNLILRDGHASKVPVSRAAAKRLFRLLENH